MQFKKNLNLEGKDCFNVLRKQTSCLLFTIDTTKIFVT